MKASAPCYFSLLSWFFPESFILGVIFTPVQSGRRKVLWEFTCWLNWRLSNDKAVPNKYDLRDQLTSCSVFTNERKGNPRASGPCYAPGIVASTFCSCSKLFEALTEPQTVTTTRTPPKGGLVWTDTFTMSTITENSYEHPMACCSKTCQIYASSIQITYWHVDLSTMNSSITAAPASSP